MTIKENNLLEIGNSYVYADWTHPDTNMQLIAIFRDPEKDGSWYMEQVRGPWSVVTNGRVGDSMIPTLEEVAAHADRTEEFAEIFDATAHAAIKLFQRLNLLGVDTVKQKWSGTVYDR